MLSLVFPRIRSSTITLSAQQLRGQACNPLTLYFSGIALRLREQDARLTLFLLIISTPAARYIPISSLANVTVSKGTPSM
jgi:hypothetical protein